MTQDQQPEVADALNKIETALRFQRNRIEPTGDEGVEYMLALQTIRSHLQQRPLPVREPTDEQIEAGARVLYQDATSLGDVGWGRKWARRVYEAMLSASPSVQNMGEGETGKDGVQGTLAGQRQEGGGA